MKHIELLVKSRVSERNNSDKILDQQKFWHKMRHSDDAKIFVLEKFIKNTSN